MSPSWIQVRKHAFLVLALVAAALAARLPALSWGLDRGEFFEPDEIQHLRIAKGLLSRLRAFPTQAEAAEQPRNTRSFGSQIAWLALVAHQTGMDLTDVRIVLLGRALSAAYGALSVVFLYLLASRLCGAPLPAFSAAFVLAVSDLHVTYSHYAVPEVAHTFWFLFAVGLLAIRGKGTQGLPVRCGIGLGIGMCLGLKFDPLPGLAFLVLLGAEKDKAWRQKGLETVQVGLVSLLALAVSWATVDPSDYGASLKGLWAENRDIIESDDHLLLNPLLYAAAVVAGMGAPAVGLAAWGLVRWLSEKDASRRKLALILCGPPLAYFLVCWLSDSTFVRRASVFVPFLALFCGAGIQYLEQRRVRITVGGPIAVYTAGFCALSQCAFIQEPRYRAQEYLQSQYGSTESVRVAYSPYAHAAVSHLDEPVYLLQPHVISQWLHSNVDAVVLHETYYGRYDKSFTTPFRVPATCAEVYHGDPVQMKLIQSIMGGRSPFELVQVFRVRHPFPERLLFKALFGTYETFLGDVLVYAKPETAPKSRPESR
jgi:hypothetical protein